MNPLFWYPPAETRISPRSFIDALLGKNHDFEKDLCSYLGIENCILGNSGRAMMTLLLRALKTADARNRDEVLIPAYTCYSVAASVVKAGLKIRVYDLDPDTFHPDVFSLKQQAGDRTLAIVAQHLFGIPSPLDELKATAEDVHAYLVEDAAQALGGTLKGKHVGTIGDFGFFSFGRGKPLPLGHGGALVAKDPETVRKIALPGRAGKGYGGLFTSMATRFLSNKRLYGIMEALPLGLGETVFDPGFEISPMREMTGRLGSAALNELDRSNKHRRTISGFYSSMLHNCGIVPVPDGACPIYARFPLMSDGAGIPDELRRLGVRRMYPRALADEPAIRKFFADDKAASPGATRIAERLVTLPTHSGISAEVAETIAERIKDGLICRR